MFNPKNTNQQPTTESIQEMNIDTTNMGISFAEMLKAYVHATVRDALHELKTEIAALVAPRLEPEAMNFDQTLAYLNANGFEISKGNLYKATSSRDIPFYKFGGKLHFKTAEVKAWATGKLVSGNAVGSLIPVEIPMGKGGKR